MAGTHCRLYRLSLSNSEKRTLPSLSESVSDELMLESLIISTPKPLPDAITSTPEISQQSRRTNREKIAVEVDKSWNVYGKAAMVQAEEMARMFTLKYCVILGERRCFGWLTCRVAAHSVGAGVAVSGLIASSRISGMRRRVSYAWFDQYHHFTNCCFYLIYNYAWFVQYHHFTNCCFYLIYNYVQYIYLFFIFAWTYIYFYLTRKAQLNNCFGWILWRYINKNYYYYIIIMVPYCFLGY